MDAGALRCAWNVVGGIRRHEHLVDDVDEAVGGDDVGHRDIGIVDHDAVADGERQGIPVGSGG